MSESKPLTYESFLNFSREAFRPSGHEPNGYIIVDGLAVLVRDVELRGWANPTWLKEQIEKAEREK